MAYLPSNPMTLLHIIAKARRRGASRSGGNAEPLEYFAVFSSLRIMSATSMVWQMATDRFRPRASETQSPEPDVAPPCPSLGLVGGCGMALTPEGEARFIDALGLTNANTRRYRVFYR